MRARARARARVCVCVCEREGGGHTHTYSLTLTMSWVRVVCCADQAQPVFANSQLPLVQRNGACNAQTCTCVNTREQTHPPEFAFHLSSHDFMSLLVLHDNHGLVFAEHTSDEFDAASTAFQHDEVQQSERRHNADELWDEGVAPARVISQRTTRKAAAASATVSAVQAVQAVGGGRTKTRRPRRR